MDARATSPPYRTRLAIVGAGFAGLGLAIRLLQNGWRDFLIFERAEAVGGVWRDNVYPGCACDIESYLYSLSFAPNPDWHESFSGQAEIQAYLKRLVVEYRLEPFLRLGHTLLSARWRNTSWHFETSAGNGVADFLISATGAFSEPAIPALAGLESFTGPIFHSARWNSRVPLEGKSVAVIGTGASAIQFVPEIQPMVGRLWLFQRTPPWVMPRAQRRISAPRRARLARYPWLLKLLRLNIYLQREALGYGFRHTACMELLKRVALAHLKRSIADPELRRKLTPDYTIGCKRILLSNRYYPALAQQNVAVLTSPIRLVEAQAVVTADGQRYPADVLIFGTGFQVTDYPIARSIFGRSGCCLAEIWQGSPAAHLGMMIPDFPNLFFLLGPNTGLGHNSVVLMIEAQITQLLKMLGHLQAHDLVALEPLPESYRQFCRQLLERSRSTVWVSGGCRSWYLDAQGRNATLWPGSVGSYRRLLARFEAGHFHYQARTPEWGDEA